MEKTLPFIDKVNAMYGIIVTILTYVLGKHWFLFVAFLCANILDYVTGCMKSRMTGKSNSVKGSEGILKKFGYWLMILLAFGMSYVFIEIGNTINVDLSITSLIGYYVLVTLIINEIRSIVENFVEAGYNVPAVLVKGLEVANKAIDGKLKIDVETGTVEADISKELAENQKKVTLEVEKIGDRTWVKKNQSK